MRNVINKILTWEIVKATAGSLLWDRVCLKKNNGGEKF